MAVSLVDDEYTDEPKCSRAKEKQSAKPTNLLFEQREHNNKIPKTTLNMTSTCKIQFTRGMNVRGGLAGNLTHSRGSKYGRIFGCSTASM